MKNKLGDKIRLQHILDAIEEIETYLNTIVRLTEKYSSPNLKANCSQTKCYL